ncbi:carbohydrate kinase family protein [Pontibacter anaerobius]|uniref:Carbohydrate kinase family protein n=1 Tax=Pontibacter anaerobius TaxID=2993940 RepID=A0ABT3RD49_9BACT|nr:carbohydrate kinase family protein [Pontibacter anaerobius]MCX2739772.1 carbohydrate kinase family protein [Pontibacter anaerobius]
MKHQLVTIADLCLDILFTADVVPKYGQVEQFVNDYHVDLGGSAAIFASQFAKLGGNPALFGVVGTDTFGDILTLKLHESGIMTDYLVKDTETKTAVGLGLAKGDDRAMLTYKGTMQSVTPERIRKAGILREAKHIHIASFYLLDQLHELWEQELKSLKQNGVTVSLDTNWAPEGNWQAVHSILGYVDVFIPNEEEALLISGQPTCDLAGEWLSTKCGLVVIKRGAAGASVYQNKEAVHFQVPSALTKHLEIADTTGAGDNFAAGFVYAWLNQNSIAESVNLAMRCGTTSLSKIGGIAGQYVP